MNGELHLELDDIFERLESMVREFPETIRYISMKCGMLKEVSTRVNRIGKLQRCWPDTPHSVLYELSTKQSEPFVKVMIGLAERKYKVSQLSMVNWWRRMCSTGQDYLITYFSWQRLAETFFGHTILASDLMRVCTDNEKLLANITKTLSDDKCVDFKIRELLGGLSMQADVKEAWKAWAKSNHPDKGGDTETFLKVKLVYDEWIDIQNKLNNTNNTNNKE